jgi:hypothetical protein
MYILHLPFMLCYVVLLPYRNDWNGPTQGINAYQLPIIVAQLEVKMAYTLRVLRMVVNLFLKSSLQLSTLEGQPDRWVSPGLACRLSFVACRCRSSPAAFVRRSLLSLLAYRLAPPTVTCSEQSREVSIKFLGIMRRV